MKPGDVAESVEEERNERIRQRQEKTRFRPLRVSRREETTPRRAETIALVPSPEPARDGRRERARARGVRRTLRACSTATSRSWTARATTRFVRARASVQINSIDADRTTVSRVSPL